MKNKLIFILGLIIGMMLSSICVYAATLYEATEVSYDNSSSGTSNTNVQSALDELYGKVSSSVIPSGYTLKFGSLSVSSVNSNNNIIPVVVYITFSQGAGTPAQTVTYGGTSVFYVRMYDSGGRAYVFLGEDSLKGIKKQIATQNVSSSVTVWLEKTA